MKIEVVKVGYLRTNCYIVSKGKDAIIIDPGDEANKINKYTKDLNVKGIYVTHTHPDHVGALKDLEIKHQLSANDFKKSPFVMEVIKTPGHYHDSLTFYFKDEKVMFTGDFLFKDSIGRVDLYGSNKEDMKNSLKLIKNYPNDVIIYPGHGQESTLGIEKERFDFYIERVL